MLIFSVIRNSQNIREYYVLNYRITCIRIDIFSTLSWSSMVKWPNNEVNCDIEKVLIWDEEPFQIKNSSQINNLR